jgi:hypothetical protein
MRCTLVLCHALPWAIRPAFLLQESRLLAVFRCLPGTATNLLKRGFAATCQLLAQEEEGLRQRVYRLLLSPLHPQILEEGEVNVEVNLGSEEKPHQPCASSSHHLYPEEER